MRICIYELYIYMMYIYIYTYYVYIHIMYIYILCIYTYLCIHKLHNPNSMLDSNSRKSVFKGVNSMSFTDLATFSSSPVSATGTWPSHQHVHQGWRPRPRISQGRGAKAALGDEFHGPWGFLRKKNERLDKV